MSFGESGLVFHGNTDPANASNACSGNRPVQASLPHRLQQGHHFAREPERLRACTILSGSSRNASGSSCSHRNFTSLDSYADSMAALSFYWVFTTVWQVWEIMVTGMKVDERRRFNIILLFNKTQSKTLGLCRAGIYVHVVTYFQIKHLIEQEKKLGWEWILSIRC